MNLKKLVVNNRSRRLFDQSKILVKQDMLDLIELARVTPSGMNKQPLKYALTVTPDTCAEVFPLLGWAGYLKDWKGPIEGERPTGYIAILLDKEISESPGCDHGIAAQTIMLGAVEKGLGGCIVATFNRKKMSHIFNLDDQYEILLVLALGVPTEEVVIESLSSDGKIEYWRTSDGKHHVPKRSLDDIIVGHVDQK